MPRRLYLGWEQVEDTGLAGANVKQKIIACLILALIIYVLNKPIFARKAI